jgi:hypothetical protein
MTLSFSAVECQRCGARRQTRFPCPDCGKAAASTEIDVKVQARQRAIEDAAAARLGEVGRLNSNAMALLASGELVDLPTRVFASANRLAVGERRASEEFAALAREVASLECWANQTVPLRPLVTLTHHAKAVVRALIEVYDVIAAALVEERLERAQRAADAVQGALDVAAVEAAKANDVLERASRVLAVGDPLGAWVAEAFEGDPGAATARGQALLEAHTGRAGGPGAGIAAVFYDTVVSVIGDPDDFWRLVRAQVQLLDSVRPEIPVIVSDRAFSSRAVDVIHDMWDAARRAAVEPDMETLRSTARDLLEAGHLLVEQPLKFQLGSICAATTRMTFADTQARDVSELINIARDRGWVVGAAIGDSDMRNAFAHRDFEIANDEVSLSPQRRRRSGQPELLLPLDRLQDRVLRLVETLAAMDLALTIAMDDLGVGVHASSLGRFLSGPLLAGLGWTEIDIGEAQGMVTISAAVHGPVPLNVIAFAAQLFVGSAQRLVLRLSRSDAGTSSEISVYLDAYEAWAGADNELDRDAAFVRMGRATLVNDHPLFCDGRVEKYLAFRGCEVLVDRTLQGRDLARHVNTWRRVARDLGLDELQRQLGKGLRLRLQAETGLAFDPAEFGGLLERVGRTVPGLPDTLL